VQIYRGVVVVVVITFIGEMDQTFRRPCLWLSALCTHRDLLDGKKISVVISIRYFSVCLRMSHLPGLEFCRYGRRIQTAAKAMLSIFGWRQVEAIGVGSSAHGRDRTDCESSLGPNCRCASGENARNKEEASSLKRA
jgi:hypothetical protein